ncbi:hypothetical protein ABEB36_013278 [Hypothenemus hampei]|uniref:SOCS box domain-containing protein n=1 Tax=Hypothenemus hampei TaxID=57062 RepID=A0ABD1EBV9_HYPHA
MYKFFQSADPNEELMKNILEYKFKNIRLTDDIDVNKVCKNGLTLLCAAAKTRELSLLKILVEFQLSKLESNTTNSIKNAECKTSDPSLTHLKKIDHFDLDGPTPEGMDCLEWDVEVNSDENNTIEIGDTVNKKYIELYKWYAKILNDTAPYLVPIKTDFSTYDRRGHSVLHHAVLCGSTLMVEYLIDRLGSRVNIDQRTLRGASCLDLAFTEKLEYMVRFLINKGAKLTVTADGVCQTSLHMATRWCTPDIVKLVLDAGANVNALDIVGRSALHLAILKNNTDKVEILCQAGANTNAVDEHDQFPLLSAFKLYNAAMIKLLLNHGARITCPFLLHKAVKIGDLDVVKMLIDQGVPSDLQNRKGYTPLMNAFRPIKNIDLIKYLLTKPCDINATDYYNGESAIHHCVNNVRDIRSISLIDVLADAGADLNIRSRKGYQLQRALMLILSDVTNQEKRIMALIRNGASVDNEFCEGWNTLTAAVESFSLTICKAIHYAGFKPKNEEELIVSSATDKCENIEYYLLAKSNPLSLKHLCRIQIRKAIGSIRLRLKILTLPLPTSIHRYLAMEDLE